MSFVRLRELVSFEPVLLQSENVFELGGITKSNNLSKAQTQTT